MFKLTPLLHCMDTVLRYKIKLVFYNSWNGCIHRNLHYKAVFLHIYNADIFAVFNIIPAQPKGRLQKHSLAIVYRNQWLNWFP